MRASEIEIDLGTVSMRCSTDEIATTFADLLSEMRSVIPRLREDERDVLRQIMSQESGTLTVADVFPGFSRESEGHKTLRRLRAAQFIRPAQTGRWDPAERIEVKPFARLMWDHVGEDTIFVGVSPVPVAAPSEPADEVVDLGLGDAEVTVTVQPPADDVVELAVTGTEESSSAAEPVATAEPGDEVVDLQDVEEEKPARAAPAKSSSGRFEDDNVLDVGDLDDLYAYAQEEVKGKQ